MSAHQPQKDLAVLVADADIEFVLKGLLPRGAALGIRTITLDVYRHLHHDPGCLNESHDFLRTSLRSHLHALVVFDREGSGQEQLPRTELEERVERLLARNGWDDRAAAVVIDPELEQWVWSPAQELDRALGWVGRTPDLRSWLGSRGLLARDEAKPARPKEALAAALRHVKRPLSPSIFQQLGRSLPLRGCTDPAFAKLVNTLQGWFPRPEGLPVVREDEGVWVDDLVNGY
jgi:hypothetical protein